MAILRTAASETNSSSTNRIFVWQYIHFIYIPAVYIISFYMFHSFHVLMNSINWPASSVWVFIAQLVTLQRERWGHGFESRWSPPSDAPLQKKTKTKTKTKKTKKNFFSGYTSQLLRLRFNCDGHIFISFQYNFCMQVCDEINWLIDWWMNGWMDWLIDWLIDRFLFPTTVLGHWK